MKVTFFSNFLNHHQLPFCEEMINILGDNFKFVATEKIPEERINMGYEDINDKYNFVIKAYENEEKACELATESDIVIIGSASRKYIKKRLKDKTKVTFKYSERLFRGNNIKLIFKKMYYKYIKERVQCDKYFLLCASAYAASDYNSLGLFKKKAFSWGYFTEVKEYSKIDELIEEKEDNSLLWVARFIHLKHPEVVIEIAKRLKEANYPFNIKMIGNGKEYNNIEKLISENNLNDKIELLGVMSPQNVRKAMEKSKIFLFTSDKNEGWGAVTNEAMNSACAVIASHEIGSVPAVIKNGENGLIYEDGNIDDLYSKICLLLDNKDIANKLGKEAYKTMVELWNPKIAAKRIVALSKKILNNEQYIKYESGPCSLDRALDDNWYKKSGETNASKRKVGRNIHQK